MAACHGYANVLGMLEAAGGEQGAREQTERVLEELARLREDAEKKKTEILSRQGAARIAREEAARVAREKEERWMPELQCRAELTLQTNSMRTDGTHLSCSEGAPVYLAMVSEYICAELLALAGQNLCFPTGGRPDLCYRVTMPLCPTFVSP